MQTRGLGNLIILSGVCTVVAQIYARRGGIGSLKNDGAVANHGVDATIASILFQQGYPPLHALIVVVVDERRIHHHQVLEGNVVCSYQPYHRISV